MRFGAKEFRPKKVSRENINKSNSMKMLDHQLPEYSENDQQKFNDRTSFSNTILLNID
jgi:hypothetical protein